MNCRVLVEFMWSSGMEGDVRASDYCRDGWPGASKPAEITWLGDTHVAHMTAARIHSVAGDVGPMLTPGGGGWGPA